MRKVYAVTKCVLSLEIVYNADDGSYGHFLLERMVGWPGTPMVGQQFVEMQAPVIRPDAYTVKEVSCVVDDDEHDGEPYLSVWLNELDLAKHQRRRNEIDAEHHTDAAHVPILVTKATCIESIQSYFDDGWELLTSSLLWWNEDGSKQDDIYFDSAGNVIRDEDDEDDDFDEDE